MANCVYCNNLFSNERFDAGYDYCLDESCQVLGLDKSEREFRQTYTPALLHKCNYFWVKKTDLRSLNMRADLE